jgi:hypothetical protein
MQRIKLLLATIGGLMAGVTLVIACDDGSAQTADAQVTQCNCPAAEPPLAGRVVIEDYFGVGRIEDDTVGLRFDAQRSCSNPRAILMTGLCTASGANHKLILEEAGGVSNAWRCSWRKELGDGPVRLDIRLNCLNPADED